MEKSENQILKHALLESKSLDPRGNKSWFHCMKTLFKLLQVPIRIPLKHNIVTFKNTLINNYKSHWLNSLGNKITNEDKLSTYRQLKNNLGFENY
jgi:hypothetical protein